MSDIGSDRLEPTARVLEPQGQEPRREPGSGARRRPPAPAPKPSEPAETPDTPPHQVDSLI